MASPNDVFGAAYTGASDAALRALLQRQSMGQQLANELALAKAKSGLESQGKEEDLARLKSAMESGDFPEGASLSTGSAHGGVSPIAKLLGMAPKEAGQFGSVVEKSYKPINDQLDAARGTLDALNQKNAASDKLALINEARLAAGQGGSKAIKSIMDSLSGGKTAGMDYQSAVNYFNNTPNIPTMQDSQRNAVRESVFNRLSQISDQNDDLKSQMAKRGSQQAPHADYNSVVKAYSDPADKKLAGLNQMKSDYDNKRGAFADSPVSNPAIADPNASIMDKLSSFLRGPQSPSPAAAPASNPGMPDTSFEAFKKWKASQKVGPNGQ